MEEYRRWEDNIKMDLKEIGVDVMNWMEPYNAHGYISTNVISCDVNALHKKLDIVLLCHQCI